MKNTFVHRSANSVVKLLQITDSHLFKDEKTELLGVNTQAGFAQVLAEIQQEKREFDVIFATGDLVQDGSDEGYQRFVEMIKPFGKPVFWIPGNHDFQPKMVENLNQSPMENAKHILLGDHWQALLLDSQVYGVPHGELSQYQLELLKLTLAEYPERYTLIVFHHHLLPTNSAWLDQHNLRNSHDLLDVLAPFKNVKAILYGHIHQQVDGQWKGYQVMATPSTCIQFKADSNHFALDTVQPGWREIDLYSDGSIVTKVKRIQQTRFLPNMQEEGY
ncbi:3',5'-cyclic-AMP phosphodiesterase [Rodentibacter myodis]|uniref:3',5'-cyclic adenosine monophosphate phosphodiesterase CpdA n=1 Tax=Rodentibacter myodis TaxID=1907939 RepID=A0A1V3JSZ5_9PAST|nr:3',5'-cyclic-AMP phosphodiesterase [Rodentibacter myodis]OOF59915.1 3',5'-cyclic-AMP phosphodiesterase [Rodentibacter myodis]